MRQKLLLIFAIFVIVKSQAQNWIPHTFSEFDNKMGYIDSVSGETKVFWHFDSAKAFKNGLALARFKGKWGCFNTKGEIVIPFVFKSLAIVDDSVAKVDYHRWDNEIYFYKGVYKALLITQDTALKNNYYYSKLDYVFISESALKNITIIDSEIKKKLLQTYSEEFVLDKIKRNAIQSEQKYSKIWNSFDVSFIRLLNSGGVSQMNFTAFKTGVYFQNKFMLYGINAAFQSNRVIKDSFKYRTIQLPLCFTTYIFIKRHLNGTVPYLRFDLGYVLGEYAERDYKKNIRPGTAATTLTSTNSKIQMNIGIGCKIGNKKNKSGLNLELGYKFAPIKIPIKTYYNHIYFTIGVLL